MAWQALGSGKATPDCQHAGGTQLRLAAIHTRLMVSVLHLALHIVQQV
jgi:hypothetical protein